MRLKLSRALLLAASAALALPATASTPPSESVAVPTTAGVTTYTWTGTSPAGAAGGGSTCPHTSASDPTQDHHVVNLTVPAGAYNAVNVSAEFRIEFDQSSGSDLVLTLEKDGANVNDSDTSGNESVSVANPAAGAFDAVVCSFLAPLPQTYTGKLILTATDKASSNPNLDTDGDGVVDRYDLCAATPGGTPVDSDGCPLQTTTGLVPRYQIHPSPPALGNDAGEPSVGFNPFTKRTMFISYTIALRETYPELDLVRKDPAGDQLPQSCNALWEDKPGTLTTLNSLDPILFTDQATGRTFNSQLSGDNSLMEYTEDDGDNWTPAQAGPPNGGADHQTVATGVYSGTAPPTATWPPAGPKRAVYYCSQSVAAAFCSRSDDGGATFGQGNQFKDLDCAAGALHGHVKVAPDGTVYVPDSSQCVLSVGGTADHVVAFTSTDNGVTFTAKPVPQSTGGDGSDPSIGIATDGTLYMCYVDADATVHMAKSTDKGDTWTGGQDIGVAKGVIQARFPQAIAGDPGRASCAFLGTSTSGNGSSLDFQGVWYGFQATTYDGGATYHTANVTPRDPIQGYGGVGPSGTNRNLLDFNDLQIDELGRTLFAFADGCINGCVKDPAANAFASKAVIVRQTGGRSLFAQYDDTTATTGVPRFNVSTPLKPTAACARDDLSQRTPLLSNLIWNAPDTGGSPVTKYTVYRSTDASTGFVVIGTTSGQTTFQDTSTNPSTPSYFYKVEAENAQGKAPIGNVIELQVSTDVVDTCTIPGETIVADATGDSTGGQEDMDIVSVSVAEPKAFGGNFVVTEKIANFTAGQPPSGAFYPLLFPLNSSYFSLDATQGAPRFTYGTYADVGQGVLQFTEDGTLDSQSTYAADGTITMVVPATFFGSPAVGAVISGFDTRARITQSGTSRDTAGPSDYTVRGIDICPDPGIALGTLLASINEGDAPLAVAFTLSGTPAQGKKLDTYSIDFGEPGGSPQTGSFDAIGAVQLPHTYAAAGIYRARLIVTDTGGNTSNPVEQTITVLGSGKGVVGNNRLGGALPPLSLLVLGLFALVRRRR